MPNKNCHRQPKDDGQTPSDPKTGNTEGHISSKAGIKKPE